jgi:uncharacterized protein (TIGR02453 family)
MTFHGFGPQALPFLKALAFHQTKEWFEANRASYEDDIKTPMGDLVEDLSAAFAAAKIPLKGDRKSSLFRINRDIRFGAVMTRGGGKNDIGVFYFHVAVDGCFTAAGFYDPEPEALARMRAAMVRAPAAWKATIAELAKSGLKPSDEYSAKRAPRGFEDVADAEIAAALRLKSIICRRPIAEDRLASAELIGDLAAFAKDARPLLDWGWSAVVDSR